MALIQDPLEGPLSGPERNNLYKTADEALDDLPSKRGISVPTQGVQVADATSYLRGLGFGGGQTKSDVSSGDSAWAAALTGNGSASATATGGGDDAWARALTGQGPAPAEQGNFSRGLSVSGKQLKQTAYGTAALIGDTVGSDKLREWGLKGYKDAENEVQAISKESDSFSNAIQSGEIGKWLSYSSGYLLGQVGELGVASLAGAALGTLAAPGGGTIAGTVAGAVEKGAVETGVKSFVGKMIDKQVTANVARGMTEKAAAESAVKTVYGTIGATTANTFLNATQELGSIYGDAVEQAALTGKEYSLGKVWLSGIMATAVDSWADSKSVGKVMDAFKGGGGVGGIAMEAFKGGFREGMTEGIQTAIERWGADKDLTSQEAFKDYIDSAAVGVLGGSVSGGGAATIKKAFSPNEKPKAEPELTKDFESTKDTAQPNLEAPVSIQREELVSILRDPDAMAYLYSKADDAGKLAIEKAVERAGSIDQFSAVKGQADAINKGQAQFSEFPEYEAALDGAIVGYAKGAGLNVQKSKTETQPTSTENTQQTQPMGDDGLRFSAVSRTPTVKDLPGAIGRVMEALVERGYHDLPGISEQVMTRMRMNDQWGALADKVTPNMLRMAYMKLQFPEKQSPAQVNAIKTDELQGIIARKPETTERVQQQPATPSQFGEATGAMKGGLAETTIDTNLDEPGDKGIAADEVEYDNYRAQQQKPARKPISPSRLTPALREYIGSMRPADQKEALLTLGGKTDEELAQFEQRIVASKQQKQQADEEAQRGRTGELDVEVEAEKPVAGINEFRQKVDNIVSMRSETQFLRDTVAKMQAALDEIDRSFRGNRTFEENGKVYEAVDDADENAYIWSNMGMGKDLPQEKLMALRRKLVEEIREMQSRSVQGRADMVKNSLKRIEYDLSIARAQALRSGLPMEEVDKVYDPARDSIISMMREVQGKNKVKEEVQTEDNSPLSNAVQSDFYESDKAVRNLVAGVKDGSIKASDAVMSAVRGIRNGDFTYSELLQVMRESGVDVPHNIMSLAGHVSMTKRMLDYVKENKYNQFFREAWLRSMDAITTQFPQLLEGNSFTDGERLALEEFRQKRAELRSATKVNETMQHSNDAEQAFDGLLFMDYTLGRLRGDMVNTRDMEALKDVYGDPVETWFQHVAFALQTRPDLRNQITEMLKPEDLAEFKEWLQRKEDQVLTDAKVNAKAPYFQALSRMAYLPEDVFDRFREQLSISQAHEAEKIVANAHKLNEAIGSKRISEEDLELIVSDYMDRAKLDSDLELEVDGTMGRETAPIDMRDESVEDLANTDEGFDFARDEGDPEDLFFSRGFFSGVLTAAQVQSVVAKIINRWRSAPQITVVQNATMLPEPLRSRVLEKAGDKVDARGLFDSETGHVYLFSDHIGSEADAQFVLFHETYGHLGLRSFLGPKFDAFLEQMYRIYPAVRSEVDAKIEAGMARLEAIEEVLADMAGENPDVGPVKSFIARIVVGLREIGLNRVADWIANISNVELSYYLAGAREAAENGGYIDNGAPGVVRFSEAQQHERLSEMFSLRGDKTTAFARFNPVTQTWFVYLANGDDIRADNNTALVSENYADVLKLMRSKGTVEFRKRSGVIIQDRNASDFVRMPQTQDLTGMKAWMRSMITKFQNEYRPVFDLVNAMKAAGRLSERMDIADALTRYERKTAAILDEFRRRFARPIESLVEEAGKQGANQQIIDRYLLASHAEERNKQIARINEKYPDGGSGMKTKVAERYLKQLEKQPYWQTLEEIGRITDEISAKKLKYQLDTGMITAKQYQAMQVYKHYVNLSGRSDLKLDEFDDPMMLAGGSKFNVKGKEKRAMGRASEATDILARTMLGMEAALIRGQKNQVAQRVLAFFEANYDPNFATINKIAYKQVIGEDGMVTEKEDENYYGNKNVMVAKINGIPNTIEFKDTSPNSFAEAIHGVVGYRDQNAVLEQLGKFNRLVGQMLTTYNPVWGAVNFIRDVQTMFFNAAADGRLTKAQAAAMVQAIPSAMKTAFYMAKTENLKQTGINPDPEMIRLYREMKLNGGLTSFLNRKDIQSQVEDLDKMLGERGRFQNAQDKVKGVFDWIEHNMSLPIEVAPRLAAYKVMRENGFSIAEAARFAGEITVNFNMRGSSQAARQLYLFFNPAVQGSAKLLSLFGTLDHDYKLKFKTKGFAYAAAWIGVGALMNLVGRAIGDDDEAGRNALDKVPTWKRATSMVFAPDTPGGAIPIPYGWNAFYAMGHFMMDSLLGIQPLSVTAGRIAKTTVESFAPLGTAGFDSSSIAGVALKGVAPTAALPIVEWVMNENRYGAPIRRSDSMFGGAKLPDSSMAFRSVNPLSDAAMKGLNEITGGNKFKSGAVDINPAAVDFIVNSYMPGFINESYKGVGMAARIARGEEVKNTPMPLVDRFTAKVPESFDAGAFRRAKEMIETKYKEYENMPRLRDEIRQEYPGLMRAHAVVAGISQQIRDLNSTLTMVENNERFTDQERVDRLNRTRDRIRVLQNKAVKEIMNAGPQFRDAVMAND
jgi:hypothetical protein